jgi:hypothetical protein
MYFPKQNITKETIQSNMNYLTNAAKQTDIGPALLTFAKMLDNAEDITDEMVAEPFIEFNVFSEQDLVTKHILRVCAYLNDFINGEISHEELTTNIGSVSDVFQKILAIWRDKNAIVAVSVNLKTQEAKELIMMA